MKQEIIIEGWCEIMPKPTGFTKGGVRIDPRLCSDVSRKSCEEFVAKGSSTDCLQPLELCKHYRFEMNCILDESKNFKNKSTSKNAVVLQPQGKCRKIQKKKESNEKSNQKDTSEEEDYLNGIMNHEWNHEKDK